MAIFTPLLCFNHMPKTAGRWVITTMRDAGIPCEVRGGGAHNCVESHQLEGRIPFAAVRHPLVWLASFHAHRIKKGKWFGLSLDALWHEDWQQFLYNCILHPEAVLDHWNYYTDWPGIRIVRCENLGEDMYQLMKSVGEQGNHNMFLARAEYVLGNHSNQRQHKIRSTTPERLDQFHRAVAPLYHRYGYLPEIPTQWVV